MTRHSRRDEQGFALVMALVAISVISIVFVAVLNNTATVAKSQEVLQEKRANDLAADGALDMAIVRLQNDSDIGTSGETAGCNTTAPAYTTLEANDQYVDPSAGTVTIKCATTTDYSGIIDTSATGKPGDNVLLALGGVYGQGYRETPGAGNGGDTTVPFCDNFLIGTQGYCEVGIFVARGNAGQDTVRIRPNGSDSNSPLVASNGAIAADVTSTPRLQVSGTQPVLAQARRECTGVTVPIASQLVCGATGNPVLNTPFFKDPFWQSNLASGVNAAQPQTPPVIPWTSWDAADANHLNDGQPNAVIKPSDKTTVLYLCQDGYMEFVPGTYVDLQPLNYLMDNCPQTTYWFKPGTYYFDFTDVGDKSWNAAAAKEFWHEPANFGQIIGGTPTFKPCVGPCSNMAQDTKVMVPDALDEEYKNGTLNTIDVMNKIDSNTGTVNLSSTNANDDSEMVGIDGLGSAGSPRALRTPMLSGDNASKVVIRIAESHADMNVLCTTGQLVQLPQDAGKPTCSPWAPGYPQLSVSLNQVGSSHCYINLNSTPVSGSGTLLIGSASVGYKDYDITNSCPGTKDSNSTFPSNTTPLNKWTPTNINKIVYNVYYKRAKWLAASNNGGTAFQPIPTTSGLNGVEIRVDYKGPPAPQYPGGCDATAGKDKGVQFVFGNLSRMAFLENDTWVELCGLATAAQPQSIALYGLGGPRCNDPVVDTTKCDTPINDTPSAMSVTSSDATASYVDATTRMISTTPISTSVSGTPTRFVVPSGSALKSGDGVVAYAPDAANSPWTQQTHATFSLKMPGNWIPAGSAIDHVKLSFKHAEPKVTSNDSAISNINVSVAAGDTSSDVSNVSQDDTSSSVGTTAVTPYTSGPTYDSTNAATPPTSYASMCSTSNCWSTWTSDDTPATSATFNTALRNAKGLNNAVITVDGWVANNGATKHQMFVDGLELTVKYRPPGQLRPLRGCMTIRTLNNRYSSGQAGQYDLSPRGYRETMWTGNGGNGASGAPNGGGWLGGLNDKAANSNQGIQDSNACSWIIFGSHSGSDLHGSKLHIAGDVYGPTVSIDLAGRTNEVSLVTDSVVARQITARRWYAGPDFSTFGSDPTFVHNPRTVTLTAYINDVAVATATVQFDDTAHTTTIQSWKRLA